MTKKVAALALGLSLTLGTVLPAMAQEPSGPAATPAPICAVLTAEEVSAALGQDLPVSSSTDTSCSWDAFATGGTVGVSVSFAPGRLADLQAAYTDATSTQIGGVPALVGPDGSFLFVEIGGGILSMFAFSFGAEAPEDLPAAVLRLAEAAVARFPSITLPPPPTLAPAPSFVGDPELRELFPDTVAGQPLVVQTLTGMELFGSVEPDDPENQARLEAINEVLSAQGKSVEDVSLGFGFFTTPEASGGISAIRVRGADITSMLDQLLPMLLTDFDDPQRTDTEVAGRRVIQVTDGDGEDADRRYAYARNDVLWIVQAVEPQLSELIGQLP